MSLLVGRSGAKLAPELYGVTKIAQLCLVMRAEPTAGSSIALLRAAETAEPILPHPRLLIYCKTE